MSSTRTFGRLALIENTVAALVLAFMVFLAWPIFGKSPTLLTNHCGCPAADVLCETPCSVCCDDPGTEEVEPCPCRLTHSTLSPEVPAHEH